jgi:hypothetical protein
VGATGPEGIPGRVQWPGVHVYWDEYVGDGRTLEATEMCKPGQTVIGGGVASPYGIDPHPDGFYDTILASRPTEKLDGWFVRVAYTYSTLILEGRRPPIEMVIQAYCVRTSP